MQVGFKRLYQVLTCVFVNSYLLRVTSVLRKEDVAAKTQNRCTVATIYQDTLLETLSGEFDETDVSVRSLDFKIFWFVNPDYTKMTLSLRASVNDLSGVSVFKYLATYLEQSFSLLLFFFSHLFLKDLFHFSQPK